MRYGVRAIAIVIFGALLSTATFADDSANKNSKSNSNNSGAAAQQAASPTPTPAPAAAPSSGPRGQYTPAVELFGGYSFVRFRPRTIAPGPTTVSEDLNFHGGSVAATYNVNNWFGLTADAFGQYHFKTTGLTSNIYSYMFGPQFSRHSEKWHPFVHALFGGAHLTESPSVTPTSSNFANVLLATGTNHENAFATALGGGVDFNATKHFGIRLFQGEYFLTKFNDAHDNMQNNFRLSTGIVLRFGVGPPPPPPNRPPVISECSANPASVIVGTPSTVTAKATDPDNDPLTYTYTTSGGKVTGSGAQVQFDSTGLAPGAYTVNCKVDDGRGGTANANTQIQVNPQPNRPPVVGDCSANPSTVNVGQPSTIATTATDPDGDPLTYSYTTTGGKVTGNGPQAQFDSSGTAPGTYTVTCHVDDGRGGVADGRTNVTVQKPAEQTRLETRLALHSVYFPTAQPTIKNPNGGLLPSQQRTLTALAADFKQYLTFKPDAHLVLQGHADPRGTEEYNKLLSDRRVERTKSFLVEQGVPAANIDTQGLGEEQPMSADQVKQAVEADQTITPAQKKQLTRNARVLALAQSRRVDITLPSTGQTSVRQFPFNAEDALNLLNPKGPTTTKPAAKKPGAKKPAGKKPPAKNP